MVMPRHSRYSDSMLLGLGLSPVGRYLPDFVSKDSDLVEMLKWSKGDFANIIDAIFDGSHVNIFDKLTSSSTPAHVKEFINNFLMKRISVVPSHYNDDEAFDSIIPRSLQTSAELSPYLDKLRSLVQEARKPSVNSSSSDTPS